MGGHPNDAGGTTMDIVRFDFSGFRVIVTGGTSGIGHATAAAFVAAGAQVTVTGTKPTLADYGQDVLSLGGATYAALKLDDEASIRAFASSVEAVDVLVNNAGHIMGTASFAEAVQVNLNAVYQLSTALQPRLRASRLPGGASVVNIASMMSFFGSPHLAGYGAAKAGVVQLTKSLAAGWAGAGVRVNAVAAGSVRTGMTATYADDPAIHKMVCDKTPMGRWGRPGEIASAILFLCSPAASFITGHTLVADGGYSIID
jgi:NAD(P)-dependent dehydrogenase (short-subunit alcohol dehydrogenase family)